MTSRRSSGSMRADSAPLSRPSRRTSPSPDGARRDLLDVRLRHLMWALRQRRAPRVVTQGSDGIQQLHTVSKRRDAEFLQVLVRQARKNRLVYVILAEDRLILPEAQAPQPDHDVHDGALNGLPLMIVQPGRGVQHSRGLPESELGQSRFVSEADRRESFAVAQRALGAQPPCRFPAPTWRARN